jgi:hypothetical protein
MACITSETKASEVICFVRLVKYPHPPDCTGLQPVRMAEKEDSLWMNMRVLWPTLMHKENQP